MAGRREFDLSCFSQGTPAWVETLEDDKTIPKHLVTTTFEALRIHRNCKTIERSLWEQMTQFHGFCSYPHGGWVLSALIISCTAALCLSMWGVSSCRFLYVDFESDRGNFGEFYLDPTANGEAATYRAGVGLFTWLVPFESSDWSQGQCAGYNQLQQELFGDTIFEVSRVFAVLSVVGGFSMTAWTIFLSCLSLRKLQIWVMSLGFFLVSCFVGLSLLIFQSGLCQDLVSYQNENYTTKCTLDQGGFITIAGSILWFVTFLICVVYVKSPENDVTFLPSGEVVNAFELRQATRQRNKIIAQQQNNKKNNTNKSHSYTNNALSNEPKPHLSTNPSIDCSDDGNTEVQLGNHRGASS